MTDIDCSKEMRGFHDTETTLSTANQKTMRERRNSGRTRLKNGLTTDKHPEPKELASQGSYAMLTMVQTPANDYDIDDGAYFNFDDLKHSNGEALTPKQARQRVCNALTKDNRLSEPATVKRNCVRQEYPSGYHIDVPVYRIATETNETGETVTRYELASGDQWTESDARAVTRWFSAKVKANSDDEDKSSQLRRITRLTKKQARSRLAWCSKTASGISITKLVVDHFVPSSGRDDLSLRKTWQSINDALKKSTVISHPVLTDTNLAEANDTEVEFFREKLSEALETLEALDAKDCDRSKACRCWDSVYNTTYFTKNKFDDEKESKAFAPMVKISEDTARREGNLGRFG